MPRKSRVTEKLYGRGDVSLRDELELIGSQIAHLSERTVGEGQENLNEEVERLKGAFEDLLERAQDTTHISIDAMATKVQERPVESMLTAFAVGALLGALIIRR